MHLSKLSISFALLTYLRVTFTVYKEKNQYVLIIMIVNMYLSNFCASHFYCIIFIALLQWT